MRVHSMLTNFVGFWFEVCRTSNQQAHGVCRPGRDKLSARTCKKLPVASFCASETAETGRIANGREQGDHVSRRQESFKVFCPTFCTLQKVGVAAERQKNLILFVRICCFGCADSRFGKTRISRKGTVLFFSLVRKERGVPQRFATLWTPGDDSKLCRKYFWRSFRRHVPNPVFRTKRRRKGFESVRGSGVTA